MDERVIELKPLQAVSTRSGGRTFLNPKASITYQNRKEMEAMLKECIDRKKTEVILDCKAVAFMDSEALEFLLQAHEDLKNLGGILKVACLNPVCSDILLATRLSNVLNIYEDVHEAIKSRL